MNLQYPFNVDTVISYIEQQVRGYDAGMAPLRQDMACKSEVSENEAVIRVIETPSARPVSEITLTLDENGNVIVMNVKTYTTNDKNAAPAQFPLGQPVNVTSSTPFDKLVSALITHIVYVKAFADTVARAANDAYGLSCNYVIMPGKAAMHQAYITLYNPDNINISGTLNAPFEHDDDIDSRSVVIHYAYGNSQFEVGNITADGTFAAFDTVQCDDDADYAIEQLFEQSASSTNKAIETIASGEKITQKRSGEILDRFSQYTANVKPVSQLIAATINQSLKMVGSNLHAGLDFQNGNQFMVKTSAGKNSTNGMLIYVTQVLTEPNNLIMTIWIDEKDWHSTFAANCRIQTNTMATHGVVLYPDGNHLLPPRIIRELQIIGKNASSNPENEHSADEEATPLNDEADELASSEETDGVNPEKIPGYTIHDTMPQPHTDDDSTTPSQNVAKDFAESLANWFNMDNANKSDKDAETISVDIEPLADDGYRVYTIDGTHTKKELGTIHGMYKANNNRVVKFTYPKGKTTRVMEYAPTAFMKPDDYLIRKLKALQPKLDNTTGKFNISYRGAKSPEMKQKEFPTPSDGLRANQPIKADEMHHVNPDDIELFSKY